MAANANKAAPAADRHEVVIKRIFAAPQAVVFRMWTEREHLTQWMRPAVFASVECEEMDVRPGGNMRTRMRLADGTEYFSEWTYREIVPASRIVYDEICTENGKLMHRAQQTVTFEEHAGNTTLTICAQLELVPGRDPKWSLDAMKQGWLGGWDNNFDLMAKQLERTA
jgi:uncharacterized protein YndB with AHSA1/START domain